MLSIPKRYRAIRTEGQLFVKSRLTTAVAVVLLSSSAPALLAQTAISAKAGLVDYTQGIVHINDHPVEATGTHFLDVKENDVVRIDGGRAEVLLGACSAMWIGDNSSFRMLSNSLMDTRIELFTGSAVVAVGATSKDSNLALVVKPGSVSLGRKGSYRFDLEPTHLKVTGGIAMVEWPGQSISVGAGQMALLNGVAEIRKFDKRNADSLDDWSKARAAILVKASNLYRQQLTPASGLDAAAAEATSPKVDREILWHPTSATTNMPPLSEIPSIPRAVNSVGYGICGGGW
jgi:hypothetical protein